MAQMILQSHEGFLRLLPALPAAWAEGEMRGLRARGGYTVDVKWQGGELAEALIRADRAGVLRLWDGREKAHEAGSVIRVRKDCIDLM